MERFISSPRCDVQQPAEVKGDDMVVSLAASGDDNAQPTLLGMNKSIYDIRTGRQRVLMLVVTSLAGFLLPLSATIYLPALDVLVSDLKTTVTMAAASVAVYMFAVGVAAPLWGIFAGRSNQDSWSEHISQLAVTVD
jgi:hypothetical protein